MITQSLFKKTTAVFTAIAMFATMFIGAVPVRVAEAAPIAQRYNNSYDVTCTVKVKNQPMPVVFQLRGIAEDKLDNILSDRNYESVISLKYQVGATTKTVNDNDANDVNKTAGRIESTELKAWVDESGKLHIKTVKFRPDNPGNNNFIFNYEVEGKGTYDGKAKIEYDLALVGTHYEPGPSAEAIYGVKQGCKLFGSKHKTVTHKFSLDGAGIPGDFIIDKGRLAPIYKKTTHKVQEVYREGDQYFGKGFGEKIITDDNELSNWRATSYADDLRALLITQHTKYEWFNGWDGEYRAKYTLFTCKPVESVLHEHELDNGKNKFDANGNYINLPDTYYRYQSKGLFLIKSRTPLMQIGEDYDDYSQTYLGAYDEDMALQLGKTGNPNDPEQTFSYPMYVGDYLTNPMFDRFHGWEDKDREKGFKYRLKLKITPFGEEEPLPEKTVYLRPGETTDVKNVANMNLTFLLREDGGDYDRKAKLFVGAMPAIPDDDKYKETHPPFSFPYDLPEEYEYNEIDEYSPCPISNPMDFLAEKCRDAEYHLKSLTISDIRVEDNSELDIDKRNDIIDINGLVVHIDGDSRQVYACKQNLVPKAEIVSYTTENIEGTEATFNTSDPSFTEPVYAKSDKLVTVKGRGIPSTPNSGIEDHRITTHIQPDLWPDIEQSATNPNEADMLLNEQYDPMKPGVHKLYYRVMQTEGAWSPSAIGLLRINQPPMVYVKEIKGSKQSWEGFYTTTINKPVTIKAEALSPDGDEITELRWYKYGFEKLSEEAAESWIENYDSENLVLISKEDTTDEYVISPDGKELTFTPKKEGRYGLIFTAKDSAGEWARESQNVKLDFKVSRTPVLLIHGYLASPKQMDKIKNRLLDTYEVGIVDLQVKNLGSVAKTFGFEWKKEEDGKKFTDAFMDALKSIRLSNLFKKEGLYNFFTGTMEKNGNYTTTSGFEFEINGVPINTAAIMGLLNDEIEEQQQQDALEEIDDRYSTYSQNMDTALENVKLLKLMGVENSIDSEANIEKQPQLDKNKYTTALVNAINEEEEEYRDLLEDELRTLDWLKDKEISEKSGDGQTVTAPAIPKIIEYAGKSYDSIKSSIARAVEAYVGAVGTKDRKDRKALLLAALSQEYRSQAGDIKQYVNKNVLDVYRARERALVEGSKAENGDADKVKIATDLFLKTFCDVSLDEFVGEEIPGLTPEAAALVCRLDIMKIWDMCCRSLMSDLERNRVNKGIEAAQGKKTEADERLTAAERDVYKWESEVERLEEKVDEAQKLVHLMGAVTALKARKQPTENQWKVVEVALGKQDTDKLKSILKKSNRTSTDNKFIDDSVKRLENLIDNLKFALNGEEPKAALDRLKKELADAQAKLAEATNKRDAEKNLVEAYTEYINTQKNILAISPQKAGDALRNKLKWDFGWHDFGKPIKLGFSLIPTKRPVLAAIVTEILNWIFNDVRLLNFEIKFQKYVGIPLGDKDKYCKLHTVIGGVINIGIGSINFSKDDTSFTVGAGLAVGFKELVLDASKEIIDGLIDAFEAVDTATEVWDYLSDGGKDEDIHYCALDDRSMVTQTSKILATGTGNENRSVQESVETAQDRLYKLIRLLVSLKDGYEWTLDIIKILENKFPTESEQLKDKGDNDFFIEPVASVTLRGIEPIAVNLGLKIGVRFDFMNLANGSLRDYQDTVAEEVDRLLERTGMEKVNIIGNNMGGLIARDYAASSPETVDKVILIGTPNYGFSWAKYSVEIFDFIIGVLDAFSLITGGTTKLASTILELVKSIVEIILGPARVDMCPHSGYITTLNGNDDCEGRKSFGGVDLEEGVQYHNIYGVTGWFIPLTLTHFHIRIFNKDISIPWISDGDLVVAKSAAYVDNMKNYERKGIFGSLAKESSVIDTIVEILDGKHDYDPGGYIGGMTEGVNLAAVDESDILAVLAQAGPAAQEGYPYQEEEVARDVIADGEKHTNIYKVDSSIRELVITQKMVSGDAHLTVVAPDGTQIMSENYSTCGWATYYEDEDSGETKVYITEPQVGDWKLITEAKGGSAYYSITAGYGTDVSVVLGSTKSEYKPGETAELCAYAFKGKGNMTGVIKDVKLKARVVMPNGRTNEITLRDDGTCGDGSAGDGMFGIKFDDTKKQGVYQFVVEAEISEGDTVYKRKAVSSFTVALVPNLKIFESGISFEKNGTPVDKNSIDQGGTIQIKAQIQNEGDADAKGVRINFYEGELGDSKTSLIGTDTINVAAGSSSTAMVRWSPKYGVKFITVRIDLTGQPMQRDLRDKTAKTSVVVNKATEVRVNLGRDMVVLKNMPVTFDGTQVAVDDDEDLTYDWDLDVDNYEGLPEGQMHRTGKIVILPNGYSKTDKPYKVKLAIRRGDTAVGEGLLNVVVKDMLEGGIVANAGRDINVRVGEDVRFDGSMSKSPFVITQYVWNVDMGDGRAPKQLVGIAPVLEGGFSKPGRYVARLTVNDMVGSGPAVDEVEVTVLEPAIRVGNETVVPAEANYDESLCATVIVKEGERLSVPVMVVNPPSNTALYVSGEPEFVQIEDRGGGRGVLVIEPKIGDENSSINMFELTASGVKGNRITIWVKVVVEQVEDEVPIQMFKE